MNIVNWRSFLNALIAFSLVLVTVQALSAAQDFRSRVNTDILSAKSLEADVKAEIEFGREVAALILGNYKLVDMEELTSYVNLVGQTVAQHSGRPEIEYYFAVLDSDEINAYTAPGGYVFVTRGALAIMQDEAELAAVLAHEIAHVTRKHIVKELNIRGSDNAGLAGSVAHLLGGASDPTRVAFVQALENAMDLLFTSGLKKEDEYESDQVGTMLLATTGYDPQALYRYLQRVKTAKEEQVSVLNNTHPSFSERLAALDRLIQEEEFGSLAGKIVEGRFRQYVKK